ncbi:MAG: DUF5106 domain-containing protein, partial [Saprospiraceae bacterium]|nr:DUF5106 domain-containing protein [Saprospiraceae bacterium]
GCIRLMHALLGVMLIPGVLVALAGCGPTAADGSDSVSGTGNGLDVVLQVEGLEGGHAFLGGMLGDQYYTVDSFAVDKKGRISFTSAGPLEQGLYYAILPDRQSQVQLLLSEDQAFTLTTRLGDLVGSMVVEGSLDNELLYRNLKFEQQYQREYQAIRQRQAQAQPGSPDALSLENERKAKLEERKAHIAQYSRDYPDAFFTSFKLAGQNPEVKEPRLPSGEIDERMQLYLYRKEFWEMVDFTDGRLLRTPVYHNKLQKYFETLMPQQVDTIIKYADYLTRQSMQHDSLFKYTANWIGVKYKEPSFMGADAVYTHMVLNFFTPELAFWSDPNEIRYLQQDARIRNLSLPGRTGQDLSLVGLNGEEVTLHGIDARMIVLFIYTPECDNCRKETPKVLEVYHEWRDRGVEVLGLCTLNDEAVWKDYVAKGNLDWINAYDPANPQDHTYKWHVDITPELYVMNSDFEIVGKDLKAFQLPEIFKRVLNK